MDLLGDVVEKDTEAGGAADIRCSAGGFPEPFRPKQISSWKQRLARSGAAAAAGAAGAAGAAAGAAGNAPPSAARSIHEESLRTLQQMSPEAIATEQQELLQSLDPKLVQRLLRNIDSRSRQQGQPPLFAEVEGAPGTWVGGEPPQLDDEQVDRALGVAPAAAPAAAAGAPAGPAAHRDLDDDDVAPLDFQAAQSVDHMTNRDLFHDVHFPAPPPPPPPPPLSIHDPDFDAKLHSRFFPDLPRDTEKLKWMQPVPDAPAHAAVADVSQCRFDLSGNLVPPSRQIDSTTHSALHHHSDDPELAGYTIPELQRLSRSAFPAQRAIALQTLGRILHKLGKQSYYQLVPEVDSETYEADGGVQAVTDKIYAQFWDLCSDCRIVDCLQDAADESKTRHLSVRNYAVEALWLWRTGGGDFRTQAI